MKKNDFISQWRAESEILAGIMGHPKFEIFVEWYLGQSEASVAMLPLSCKPWGDKDDDMLFVCEGDKKIICVLGRHGCTVPFLGADQYTSEYFESAQDKCVFLLHVSCFWLMLMEIFLWISEGKSHERWGADVELDFKAILQRYAGQLTPQDFVRKSFRLRVEVMDGRELQKG